nr:uncharacterized protein LOC113811563 [Penaeus vannamei]
MRKKGVGGRIGEKLEEAEVLPMLRRGGDVEDEDRNTSIGTAFRNPAQDPTRNSQQKHPYRNHNKNPPATPQQESPLGPPNRTPHQELPCGIPTRIPQTAIPNRNSTRIQQQESPPGSHPTPPRGPHQDPKPERQQEPAQTEGLPDPGWHRAPRRCHFPVRKGRQSMNTNKRKQHINKIIPIPPPTSGASYPHLKKARDRSILNSSIIENREGTEILRTLMLYSIQVMRSRGRDLDISLISHDRRLSRCAELRPQRSAYDRCISHHKATVTVTIGPLQRPTTRAPQRSP